MPPFTIIFVSL